MEKLKSFRFYDPAISNEEKTIKYSGFLAAGLLIIGDFATLVFLYSIPLIIIIALSVPFSRFVAKNKFVYTLFLIINFFVILTALTINIYFFVTGKEVKVIGL